MAYTTISNGDNPSAVVLMANFAFLKDGGGMKIDTFANLQIHAALNPTVPFICVASDASLFLLYCGDVTSGNTGFITLASWVPGGIT